MHGKGVFIHHGEATIYYTREQTLNAINRVKKNLFPIDNWLYN